MTGTAMQLQSLIDAMETIAPTRFAEPWDNVGLLVGDPQQPVSRVLLTIDYTRAVAEEGKRLGCDAVIAYHPVIFDPLKRIVAGSVVYDALRRGVAIWSPHTALDVADGGTNDMLADALALVDRQPLKPAETRDREYKLITFVPREHVDQVADALFAAGCGHIGQYTHCSFRSEGQGTFFGQEGTNPTVGQAGRLETADEIRLETVVPIAQLPQALQALRRSHPYEEPAFDLVRLAAPPEGHGIGRIGKVPGEATAEMLINLLKRELELDRVLVAGDTSNIVRRVAVCAGACGKLLEEARRQKVDLYVTGELRHHDALAAAQAGMTVVCTLHSNSERKVLARLQKRLKELLPSLPTHISEADRDPFAVV